MSRGSNWGSGTYIDKATALLTAPPMSMHAWYNPVNFTGDSGPVNIAPASGFQNTFNLQIWGTSSPTKVALAEAGTSSPSNFFCDARFENPGTMVAGTWYSILGVWTNTTTRLCYRNGVAGIAPGDPTNNPSTACVPVVGNLTHNQIGILNTANACHGSIALVAIWNVALTQADATALANGFHPRKIQPSALKACLTLAGPSTPASEADLVASAWTINGGLNSDTATPTMPPVRW